MVMKWTWGIMAPVVTLVVVLKMIRLPVHFAKKAEQAMSTGHSGVNNTTGLTGKGMSNSTT